MATKATSRIVDLSNVKEQGNFNPKRLPSGDYLARIAKVEDVDSKKDNIPMWLFTIKLEAHSQTAYPYYCKLQENQLWKVRNLFIAAGKTVPKKKMKLDPNGLVGKVVGVTLEDDEYEGRERSTVQAVFPAADLSDGVYVGTDDDDDDEDYDEDIVEAEVVDEDEEEEEVAPTPRRKKAPEPEPEEDEDEEEAEEEEEDGDTMPFADLDRAKLKRELKKIDPTYSVKRSQSDDDLRLELARLTNEGPAEDEEEEEEEAPAPVKRGRGRPRKAQPKAEEISDDELEELDLDELL